MALTASTMLPLGTIAPDFSLPDTEGGMVSLADHAGSKAYLIMFICNHCPYVKHVAAELARLGRDYMPRGVAVLAINANDPGKYPDDSPANMKKEKQAQGYPFSYLYDESQEVARAYAAACTPDFFVFDAAKKLVYRGQLDDSRPNSGRPVTGRDLRAALDAVLAGKPAPTEQRPSAGCNIKWKAEN
ncbi:MAG: thioredoxin family protein [Phycisphaeraceae bacterium]|nr:thioredoxin family protein [Phycisphaeraceae bacterium]